MLRVGPPAPSVGIYGIAAPPGSGRVYVSNLHVPFLTVLDAETGALLDAIDLRDGCAEQAFFPRLFVAGGTLWVTDLRDGRLCRYDLAADAWAEPVEVAGMGGGLAVDGDDLWVATPDALLRYDATGLVESVPAPGWASALDIDEDGTFAVLVGPERRLVVLERDGTARWEAALDGDTLNDVALLGGRAYVTDRASGAVIAVADGAEVDRVVTGSDTFAVDRLGDALLVTNRQGGELPASGAYEGAPGLVTALDADLSVRWRVPLDKTIHFLAFDGARVWTANEDALRVSAIDPDAGVEVLRTDPVGLTVDHLAEADGAWFFGSHLTDEVWRVDPAGSARGAEVCGWPFVTLPTTAGLVVPCQEDGEVWTLDPTTLARTARLDFAETFAAACPGGLCTGHDALVAAAVDGDAVVLSDPHEGRVLWTDGRSVDLGFFPEPGHLRHMGVAPVGDVVLAFEPRTTTVHAVADGAVVATLPFADETAMFPLVADGARAWIGGVALDGALAEVARLPGGAVVQAVGDGYVVATADEDLVVYDATLAEVARLALTDLRVPPWRTLAGELGPMRYLVRDGELLVGNTMRGTLERRALPDLAPVGTDTPVPVGRWAALPGLR